MSGTYFDAHGRPVVLTQKLGDGAEGQVWEVEGAKKGCVKILKEEKRDSAKFDKLRAMVENPPRGLGQQQTAWPKSLVYEDPQLQRPAGFVMVRLDQQRFRPIDTTWSPETPCGRIYSWGERLRIASRLAGIVAEIHVAGHAVGDLQRRNVLVSADCEVFIVDCDSFEIQEPDGSFHASEVGSEGYVPHEVLELLDRGERFSNIRRHHSDRFALAVLIFELLMGGDHPMTCRGAGVSAQLRSRDAKVKAGLYAYAGRSDVLPRVGAQPLATLPQNLRELFRRAFVDGYRDPVMRPTAEIWRRSLEAIQLAQCQRSTAHVYDDSLPGCPWCQWDSHRERAARRRDYATQNANSLPPPVEPPTQEPSGTQLILWPFYLAFAFVVLIILSKC